jgi:hypothetical protein
METDPEEDAPYARCCASSTAAVTATWSTSERLSILSQISCAARPALGPEALLFFTPPTDDQLLDALAVLDPGSDGAESPPWAALLPRLLGR